MKPICFYRFPYSDGIKLSFSALAERLFKGLKGVCVGGGRGVLRRHSCRESWKTAVVTAHQFLACGFLSFSESI